MRSPGTGRNATGQKKRDELARKSGGGTLSGAAAAPRLYCDSAEVIHVVTEEEGQFRSLRRGDHCMIPLNLALGQYAALDNLIDILADFELIQFSHHFIVLNDVHRLKPGEEGYVAEFTNNPADFIKKAETIGYSGAFMDKASFQRTPLSAYRGRLVFKVVEEEPLTAEQRDLRVEKAMEALEHSKTGQFQKYNVLLENCEHATTELLQRAKKAHKTSGPGVMTGQGSSMDGPLAIERETARRSPQVEFAGWNTMRFLIQCAGAIFLHFVKSGWTWAAASYAVLCVAPVAMQSVASFGLAVRRVRGLLVKGTIDGAAFRHLWLKELFRCIIVGAGSSTFMGFAPLAVHYEYVSPWPAGFVVLGVFFSMNHAYSVLAQVVDCSSKFRPVHPSVLFGVVPERPRWPTHAQRYNLFHPPQYHPLTG